MEQNIPQSWPIWRWRGWGIYLYTSCYPHWLSIALMDISFPYFGVVPVHGWISSTDLEKTAEKHRRYTDARHWYVGVSTTSLLNSGGPQVATSSICTVKQRAGTLQPINLYPYLGCTSYMTLGKLLNLNEL